jgi:hypothetical protein
MIRLDRSLPGRLWGGARLQPLVLTFVVLVAIRVVGQAAGLIGDRSLSLTWTALVWAVLVALLLVGATGWAAADDAGVQWRYYRTHRYAWSEIEQLCLDRKVIGITAVRYVLVLQAHGRRHEIVPAHMAGPGRKAFARQLAATAAARGIPVVDRWS